MIQINDCFRIVPRKNSWGEVTSWVCQEWDGDGHKEWWESITKPMTREHMLDYLKAKQAPSEAIEAFRIECLL